MHASTEKPLLRGYFHALWTFIFPIMFWPVFQRVVWSLTTLDLAAYLYATGAIFQYGASAIFHTKQYRSVEEYLWYRALDHCGIYLMIAGSYTPVTLLYLKSPLLAVFLWSLAASGIYVTWTKSHCSRSVRVAMYIGYVSCLFPFLVQLPPWLLYSQIRAWIFYLIGAAVFYFQYPDPFPQYLGYHEVFHIMTILGGQEMFNLNHAIFHIVVEN